MKNIARIASTGLVAVFATAALAGSAVAVPSPFDGPDKISSNYDNAPKMDSYNDNGKLMISFGDKDGIKSIQWFSTGGASDFQNVPNGLKVVTLYTGLDANQQGGAYAWITDVKGNKRKALEHVEP